MKLVWYGAIFAIWIFGLGVLASQGREPYPGLFQPPFMVSKGVAREEATRVDYVVSTDQGEQRIDPLKLFVPSGGKEYDLAFGLLSGADPSDPKLCDWLAGRIAPLVDGEPTELRVTWSVGHEVLEREVFRLT